MANKIPKILLVDDEDVLRFIFRVMLENEGYAVTETQSGNEAWEKLLKSDIDLIISDIRMPNGDGLSLLDRVHQRDPTQTIILVTGFCDISEDEALSRGAAAIFKKPFDYVEFRHKVRDVIERHKHA